MGWVMATVVILFTSGLIVARRSRYQSVSELNYTINDLERNPEVQELRVRVYRGEGMN
jgi:hypothetical protein